MEKNKSFYMTLVVLVCSLFAFLGAFYLGTYFSVGKEVIKENNGFNTKGGIKEVINIPDYNYYMSTLLYNYLNNNKDKLNFNDYINKGITNNQKLYVAGIFGTSKFNDLEENLNKIFGSTLNLKPDDYYSWPSDEQPVYKYNKETNMYDYNDDVIGTDVLTDLLDSEELGIKELFIREVKEKDIPLEYPEMTLFMIIELVSSTVFTSIVEKQPLPIDEFKPHLYKTIRLLINEKID